MRQRTNLVVPLAVSVLIAWHGGAPTVAAAPRKQIRRIGHYESSNSLATRYRAILWRRGSRVLGIFQRGEGTEGNSWTARIESGHYESGTGKLSFTAIFETWNGDTYPYELIGKEGCTFSGRRQRDAVSGSLRCTQLLVTPQRPFTESIRMPRSASGLSFSDFETGDELFEMLDGIGGRAAN
jgi:hypothetical protein